MQIVYNKSFLKKRSKIYFKLKSFHHKTFEKLLIKFLYKIKSFNLFNVSIVSLPKTIKRFIVLRSPHIDKKSREHFESKFYKKLITIEYNSTNLNEIQKINYLINFLINSSAGCLLRIIYTNDKKF